MRLNVLLVEGDADLGLALGRALAPRFDCLRVTTLDEALGALARGPWAAVVAGYELGDGGTGLEALLIARTSLPRAFRVLHSAIASPGFREDARRLACPHFLGDTSAPAIVGAIERAVAELLEPPALEPAPGPPPDLTDATQVRSPVAREFLHGLRSAAERDAPAYLHGEPGAGVTRSGALMRRWRREWKERGAPGAAAGVPPVAILRVPALRERLQDLPPLAARCLLEQARETGDPARRLSPRAVAVLLDRDWFGNLLELSTVLLRAGRRAGTRPVIEAEDLPQDAQPAWRPAQRAKDDGQRDCVLRQLRLARHVCTAARLEGCSRANYIRLMRRLGIIRADVGTGPARDRRGAASGPP